MASMMVTVLILVPHVVVVGSAFSPMVLVSVGSQLLIQVKRLPTKAYEPIININIMNMWSNVVMMIPIDVTLLGIVTDLSAVHC